LARAGAHHSRNLLVFGQGWNDYDGTQWTLHLFLEGSMLVYTTMFATVMVKPKARLLVYAVLYLYYWQLGEGEPTRETLSSEKTLT
jgi:hypothetical protein